MKAVLQSPLRIAAAAIALIVLIEVATIPMSDEGVGSDARFLLEIPLVAIVILALAAAGWRRVRQ